jgi:glucose/arabinose dehydrogenase
MRSIVRVFAVLLILIFPAAGIGAAIQLAPVLSGLSKPLYVTHAHDGSGRLFIVEQGGLIKVLQPGASTPTVFLDISSRVLSDNGERGLLGLAFHPQYPSNPRFYVDYIRAGDGSTVVAEYQVTANPNVAGQTELQLLVVDQPYTNHKGGMVGFGPDGYLYIGLGDGGSSYDPQNRAQNIDELHGKILRIDVNTPNGLIPYSSPSTNPFFGATPGVDRSSRMASGTRGDFHLTGSSARSMWLMSARISGKRSISSRSATITAGGSGRAPGAPDSIQTQAVRGRATRFP